MSRRSLLLALAGVCLAASAWGAQPPRIGLVLGGGGARGAAHIGVLEVLERLRVPVHCVAGTSMGALVAGAWASGVSPERMRAEMTIADWNDMFQDSPDYDDLALRSKRLAQRFLPGTELGVGNGGLTAPSGVVTGQKIKQFFNRLVRADLGDPDIASAALPLAIVATDIGSGERVVFRSGSLTLAMRASMSVPGLMAPVEIGGRKLVDGGLVDNLPIAEVRSLCRPDVVIAVNVGTPLLAPKEVGSLLSVTAQMVGILTEQNVSRSLAELGPADIYIRPALEGITAGDFERHREAAERGRAAADGVADRLRTLALDANDYATWRTAFETLKPPPPRVDEIEVAGLRRVSPATVERHLLQGRGEPLDADGLQSQLLRIYGDGHYENVDYTLVTRNGRNVLRVLPVEKSWGPDYLRLSLSLNSSLNQGSTYSLRAAYQRTWENRLGGELLAIAELGSSSGASLEWYQPLDSRQRFFVDAALGYRRERVDLYADDLRFAQYLVQRSTVGIAGGINIGTLGALRLGWREQWLRGSLETGLPFLTRLTGRQIGWQVTLDLDQLNRLYFPSRGWALATQWYDSDQQGGYAKFTTDWRSATTFGGFVLGTRLAYSGSPRGTLPALDAAALGGFLNLSAYASGQVLADSTRYGHVRAERIIGRLPLGLRGDLRVGAAVEVARAGGPISTTRGGTLYSTSVYLGGETPLGPVFLGFSYGGPGINNAYLFVGVP